MIGIDGFVACDHRVLESVGLLFGNEDGDILLQRPLIALQRHDVVRPLLDNLARDLALTSHRIDGHNGALDGQHVQ